MIKKNLWGVDLLKVLAIIGVISFHLIDFVFDFQISGNLERGQLLDFLISKDVQLLPAIIYGGLSLLGIVGVNIFFIASGFGLQMSIIGKPINWLMFYIKRLGRILPLYWCFLFVACVLQARTGMEIDALDYLYHAIGLHSLVPAFRFSISGPLWFVSVLVQLYLVFPLFYYFLRSKFRFLFLPTITAVFLLSWLVVAPEHPRIIPASHYFLEFGLGMYLAFWISKHSLTLRAKRLLSLAGLSLGTLVCLLTLTIGSPTAISPETMRLLVSVAAMSYFIGLCWLGSKPTTKFMSFVSHVASVSYAAFLIHQPLMLFVVPGISDFSTWRALLLFIPAVFMVSTLATEIENALRGILAFFKRKIGAFARHKGR